eukprot:TRINITY_DN7148_c0_g2_i9.p1 TRINITY_DN7148_c0_g2~~TRINITY_DN7148_c0_g2_i9.p1  ORF type:complete len:551 (-),score=116.14 TRINITY_DN7148_c0_g2_i9:242-1894(-)
MIRRPPRSPLSSSSAASDVYKRQVWDFEQRKPVYHLFGLFGRVVSTSFSPDDRFLVASDTDKTFIWDMQTGQTLWTTKYSCSFTVWGQMLDPVVRRTAHIPTYTFVSAHPNGIWCHTLEFSIQKMAYVLATEECNLPSSGMVREYQCGALDASMRFLLTGTSSGDMGVFDIIGRVFRASVPVSSGGLFSVCTAGELVYTGSGDGVLRKMTGHDLNWGMLSETKLVGAIVSLALTEGGAALIAGTSSGLVYRVDTDSLEAVALSASHTAPITRVAFGARSDLFATCAKDGNVRVWDLSDYGVLTNISAPSPATCCYFTLEDEIIVGCTDGSLHCYSATDGALSWSIPNAHSKAVTHINMTPECFLSTGEDGALRLWLQSNRRMLGQFAEHSGPITGLCIDVTDDSLVHTCSSDKSVLTWDLRKECRANCHMLREGSFLHMAQRKDHEWELITTHGPGIMLQWDCDIADSVKKWEDPRGSRTSCMAMSPSGKYLAVGCDDFSVKMWDVAGDTVISVCLGHSAPVVDVKWSPDERQFVSVAQDCAICVWNFYG